MIWLASLLTTPFMEAVGWALVHLLWQGTLLGLVTAAALKLLERQPANARYLLACGSLVLLSALPVLTAARLYDPPLVIADSPALVAETRTAPSAMDLLVSEISREIRGDVAVPFTHRLFQDVKALLPWLVGFWLAGVGFLSGRLLLGWVRAQRFIVDAFEAPHRWQQSLDRLSRQLGLSLAIRLLESTRAHVPMVIGWLRPVVLVPASALTGLPADQLETILAHELAHIRRHDYLVNLLQAVVETLFFYHPAVWWLSNRIRIERELCCDDMAVTVCGNPLVYARALTELEGLRAVALTGAVAANGGSLRDRVVRLLSAPPPGCSYRWVTGVSIVSTLAAVVVAMPLSLFAYQRIQMAQEDPGAQVEVQTAPSEAAEKEVAEEADSSVEVVAPPVEKSDPEIETLVGELGLYEAPFVIAPPAPPSPAQPVPPTAVAPVTPPWPAMVPPVPMMEGLAPMALPAVEAAIPWPPFPAPSAPMTLTPFLPSFLPMEGLELALQPEPQPTPRTAPRPRLRKRVELAPPAQPVVVTTPKARQRWNGELTVDQLIALKIAGVDASYINALRDHGYGDLSFEELIALRHHGVTADFITQLKTYGFAYLTAEDLASLRIHGVTPAYAESLAKLGYGKLSVKEIVNLRIQGVTTEYAQAMNAAALGALSAKKLIELRIHGVDPVYLSEITAAGYGKLNADEVIQLRIQGITAAYVRALQNAGFENLSVRDLVRLRANGIDKEFLEEMKKYKKK